MIYPYLNFVKPIVTNIKKLMIIVTSATVAGTFVKNSAIPGRQFIFIFPSTLYLMNRLRSELAIATITYPAMADSQNTAPINTVILLFCCLI